MSMNSLFSGVFFSDHVDLQAVPGPVARLLFEFETYTQEGGLTSSGVGLLGCMRALQSSTSTLQKVIVLVTDDTLDTTMPEGSGSAVAASLKDDGVIIATLIAGAAPNVTLAYASSPSLSFHLTDSFYLANPRPIINGLCSVPMPARASPSPRISPSPRPLGIVIDDPFLIPIFSPSNTRHANAEAAAIGFQYYVARELSFKPMMRVTASLIRLDSPVFPWDVVMPHGSTGEATASPDPVGVDDWKRGGGARMCGGRFDDMCAAHVVITADRKIPRSKVRTAFKMLKRNHAGFLQVFMQTKGKFRIVETGLYEYSVFLPFVNEAITV